LLRDCTGSAGAWHQMTVFYSGNCVDIDFQLRQLEILVRCFITAGKSGSQVLPDLHSQESRTSAENLEDFVENNKNISLYCIMFGQKAFLITLHVEQNP